MQLHAAPCISKLNLKGLHTASVVFKVYTVVPCCSMRLHASLDLIERVSIWLLLYLKFTRWLHAAPVVFAGTVKKRDVISVTKGHYGKNIGRAQEHFRGEVQEVFSKVAEALGKVCELARGNFERD